MSDIMKPIPFENLFKWILIENKKSHSIFNTKKYFEPNDNINFNIFNQKIETPIGPAAGPNTQLAQNIVAAYVAGSRFFELKTIQKIDGKELSKMVNKPCILNIDECYNCEWSTELTIEEAQNEYIKAYMIIKIISKEFNLGDPNKFIFNMSVGYDLEGIKYKTVDNFIENIKNANNTKIFNDIKYWLKNNIVLFNNITEQYIDEISPYVSNSVTLSTLHGCPPEEIEKIATYLLIEKKLNTFIKCNPTLLGYKKAKQILDELGYDYLNFDETHFKNDMQYDDCIKMLNRLNDLAVKNNLEFGVKLTNTFPVNVKNNELPSDEMYMSGKSLYPLTINVAKMISKDLDGKITISFSGGANNYNVKQLVDCNIWPITVATTILKPGGYDRLYQIAEEAIKNIDSDIYKQKIDIDKLDKIIGSLNIDKHIVKNKNIKSSKIKSKQPLIDCFKALCKNSCPIHQNIPLYNYYLKNKNYDKAIQTIYKDNPLPFITGVLCPHPCSNGCIRNQYECPVNIKNNKLEIAKNGYNDYIKNIEQVKKIYKKVCIIGAGPAGISCGYFLSKYGLDVTVYDENETIGGTVSNIIPFFRINKEYINKDVEVSKKYGVKYISNTKINNIKQLENEYDYIIIAIGVHNKKEYLIGDYNTINAHDFLCKFNETNGNVDIGKKIAVIGAGNTAMDTARAAKKNKNVEEVHIIYRKTKNEMPADIDEYNEMIDDKIIFNELLSPISYSNNILECSKYKIEKIENKTHFVLTNETQKFEVDNIISAIGENVDTDFYIKNNINVDEKGYPILDENLQTNIKNVYVVGDCKSGASIIVNAICDAKKVSKSILNFDFDEVDSDYDIDKNEIYKKRGIVCEAKDDIDDRCLNCDKICELCVEVCPNRANVDILLNDGRIQILHIDSMCNECGNCKTFCPYDGEPYKNKWTLFSDKNGMENSTNNGFYFLDENTAHVRLLGEEFDYKLNQQNDKLGDLAEIINKIYNEYSYLIF